MRWQSLRSGQRTSGGGAPGGWPAARAAPWCRTVFGLVLLACLAGATPASGQTIRAGTYNIKIPGRYACGTRQGYLNSAPCEARVNTLNLYHKVLATNRQRWTITSALSPSLKTPTVGKTQLLLQVGDRTACGKYLTYPKSCSGQVTLSNRTPNNRYQHWILEAAGPGAYLLRPAACTALRLSVSKTCSKPNLHLARKGAAGVLQKLTLSGFKALPAPPVIPDKPGQSNPEPVQPPSSVPAELPPACTPATQPSMGISFAKTTAWEQGYDGAITVVNNNAYSILNWQMSFDFGGTFSYGPMPGDGNAVKDGSRVTLTPKEWKKTIAPGASLVITFGSSTPGDVPSNFAFTQLLPPVDSCNDPSLSTRGAFGSKVLAPYVDTGLSPPLDLVEAPLQATGNKFYTLAFITGQKVEGDVVLPAWAGVIPLANWHYYDLIRALRLQGGDVIVSFGGASGIELAQAITDIPKLVEAYERVLRMYNLKWVDFDIEGGAIADPPSVDRRNQALKILKDRNPGVVFSYTLPVLPQGLTQDGVALLQSAKRAGFTPDVINVMAMDYGDSAAPNPEGQMGAYAIQSATRTWEQAVEVGLSASKIGVCPMIGKNDVETEVFRLADAQQVAAWAKATPWVRWVAFWSVNRDRYDGNSYVSPLASSIPQQPYDFLKTFKANL